ncbi:MAG: hypothetical protein ACLQBC_10760 [Syntrophales bacterium]
MTKTIVDDPKVLFKRWYKIPLLELEKIPERDGGFVVLAVSCFLYERYIKALLKSKGLKENYKSRMFQIATDFKTDVATAETFWNVIRNGLLHRGTPKQIDKGKPLPIWESYDSNDPFKLSADLKVLYINVWKFRDTILELYDKRPDLIGYDNDYPWGNIWYEK